MEWMDGIQAIVQSRIDRGASLNPMTRVWGNSWDTTQLPSVCPYSSHGIEPAPDRYDLIGFHSIELVIKSTRQL
jgi:hypothetical protein